MRNSLKQTWTGGIAGALAATGLGLGIYYLQELPVCRWLISASYDLPFLFKPMVSPREVVVVTMDDDSHRELDQPFLGPWDRGVHARLVERLTAEKARAVVYDVIFSDLNRDQPDGDAAFARAIAENGRVILGGEFTQNSLQDWRTVRPADPFFDAMAGWGMVWLKPDQDLCVRQHFHFHPDAGESSISWRVAKLLDAVVTRNAESDASMRWVNYYGPPNAIPHVSFRFAIEPNQFCPTGFFRDRIVFVGGSVKTFLSGQRKDDFRTPFTRGREWVPGVDVQATQFLNLLRSDWLLRTSRRLEWWLILLSGLVFGFVLSRAPPWRATRIAFLLMVAIALAAQYLFQQHRLWFPWMIIVAAQIPAATFSSVLLNSFQLHLQKRLLEQSLSLHLPPRRIRQFVGRPELLKPGAEKQIVSIMFTDVENFTRMSEGMDSDDLARVMNDYFETTIPCIFRTEGAVIKLIGDSILGVWNAPDQHPNHRELACRSALMMRDQIVHLKGDHTGFRFRTRIGIHTGLANVGNFGSALRIDYTVIGANVNLASRLEGLNKHLGTDILISRETREGTSDRILTRPMGRFRLRGFEKAVEVHELIGRDTLSAPTKEWRVTFEQALAAFHRGDFDAAETGMRCVLEIRPEDGPAKFYLQQIVELRTNPAGPAWSGEVELKEK